MSERDMTRAARIMAVTSMRRVSTALAAAIDHGASSITISLPGTDPKRDAATRDALTVAYLRLASLCQTSLDATPDPAYDEAWAYEQLNINTTDDKENNQ